jgi:hypothetical protein
MSFHCSEGQLARVWRGLEGVEWSGGPNGEQT